MMQYPWGKGTPKVVRDATANDSDKTILTVPTGKYVVLDSLNAVLVCTATVGTRGFCFQIRNTADDVVWESSQVAGGASNTLKLRADRYGAWNVGTAIPGANASTIDALPGWPLPAGYDIRIYDNAAVDAAADDLTVTLAYVEYDV